MQICQSVQGKAAACEPLHLASNGDAKSWAIAVVGATLGAILGAALALRVQRHLASKAAKARNESRLKAVRLELDTIAVEAARRREPETGGGIRREAPLPLDAWRMLITSSELEQLNDAALEELARYYRLVQAANYLSAQAPTYILIATTARDAAVTEAYMAQARQVTTEPFAELFAAWSASGGKLRAELRN
jgi:hypothetical protein